MSNKFANNTILDMKDIPELRKRNKKLMNSVMKSTQFKPNR